MASAANSKVNTDTDGMVSMAVVPSAKSGVVEVKVRPQLRRALKCMMAEAKALWFGSTAITRDRLREKAKKLIAAARTQDETVAVRAICASVGRILESEDAQVIL